mgnify:CR=1 FL=1
MGLAVFCQICRPLNINNNGNTHRIIIEEIEIWMNQEHSAWFKTVIGVTLLIHPQTLRLPMRTIFISVFLFISFFCSSQYFFDGTGKRIAKFDNNRIYNGSGKHIGRIDKDRIYNSSGKFIGRVDGEYLYDGTGKRIGKVDGDYLYNATGKRIGRLDGDYLYDGSGKRIGRVDGLTKMQVIIFFYYFFW